MRLRSAILFNDELTMAPRRGHDWKKKQMRLRLAAKWKLAMEASSGISAGDARVDIALFLALIDSASSNVARW
jgi:hypothetical protein